MYMLIFQYSYISEAQEEHVKESMTKLVYLGLYKKYVPSRALRTRDWDFMYLTRPRSLWQQTPPQPVFNTWFELAGLRPCKG